ncbi:MAG: hypothetical protein NC299_09775 [Lachnospiraceae bacterium]|nr:hypothetical protein [Ruminococcus sp.]MCM1275642.1 hypothetical protein [Lachnospiraceae bacterium]
MAKVFLEGIQHMDFDAEDGKRICGYSLHMAYADDNVIGKRVDKKFISAEAFHNLGFSLDEIAALVQTEVELDTNIKGKVVGIHSV